MKRPLSPPPPKPCPRCYAPMQRTPAGFECARHGLSPDDPVRRHRQIPAAKARPARARARQTPRTPKPRPAPKPRPVSEQTQRLRAAQETILERNRAGEPLAAIAADLWQQLGYKDRYVAASKISRFLKLHGAKATETRPGPSPGTVSAARYTPERLAEVRAALTDGTSVWAFAGSHWREWGFTSRSSCDSLIRKWLRTKAAR